MSGNTSTTESTTETRNVLRDLAADQLRRGVDASGVEMDTIPRCLQGSPGGLFRCNLASRHHFYDGGRHELRNGYDVVRAWGDPDWIKSTIYSGEQTCGRYMTTGVMCHVHQPVGYALARSAESCPPNGPVALGFRAHVFEVDAHMVVMVLDLDAARAGVTGPDGWVVLYRHLLELRVPDDVLERPEALQVLAETGWQSPVDAGPWDRSDLFAGYTLVVEPRTDHVPAPPH